MWLWVSLGLALVAGLVKPFGSRLQATSLWAGKALAPSGTEDSHPTGLQSAINDGWPSWVGMITGLAPFISAGVGFLHAWWAGLLAFVSALVVSGVAGKTSIASKTVDRYLGIFLEHAARRHADYTTEGDELRADAAEGLTSDLERLTALYVGSGIAAPSIEVAKSAPHGDELYLKKAHQRGEL